MSLRVPPALYHKRFFYLWLGYMVSVAGSQMQVWAIHWHVRDLTDPSIAALALGSIGLARILPVFIFSLIGGAVADTANRRKLMFLTQSSQALLALGGFAQPEGANRLDRRSHFPGYPRANDRVSMVQYVRCLDRAWAQLYPVL